MIILGISYRNMYSRCFEECLNETFLWTNLSLASFLWDIDK